MQRQQADKEKRGLSELLLLAAAAAAAAAAAPTPAAGLLHLKQNKQ